MGREGPAASGEREKHGEELDYWGGIREQYVRIQDGRLEGNRKGKGLG